MTVSLILAESALEMVPSDIFYHPAVKSHARRIGKHPSCVILDNSWHYAAMKNLPDADKRGRPDLVHLAVVTVTSAPIYRVYGRLKLYVHTINDHVIHFGSCVRIPKSYHRFAGLIESLYEKDLITVNQEPPDNVDDSQHVLLELRRDQTFADLIKEKKFSKVIGLSSQAKLPDSHFPYEAVADDISDDNAAIVIGGFQKGHFSDAVADHLDHVYRVDACPLEAHVVISRLLYECEKKPFM